MIKAYKNGSDVGTIAFLNDTEAVTVYQNGERIDNISAIKTKIIQEPFEFVTEYKNGFYELYANGNTRQGEGTPSPESPISITNTGDNGTVIVKHGINLLPDYAYDIGVVVYYSSFIWSSYKDKVVYLKEGKYRVSANFTSPYARICFMAFNSEYTVSKPESQTSYFTDDYQINNAYINIYGQAQSSSNSVPSQTPIVITVKKPIYVHFWFSPRATNNSDGSSSADKQYTAYNCTLVSGTSALPYEPYIHNEIKIPSEYKLAKIGDYADEIVIKNGKIKYTQKIYKRVFAGTSSENWVFVNGTGDLHKCFYISLNPIKEISTGNGQNALCTHFEAEVFSPVNNYGTFSIINNNTSPECVLYFFYEASSVDDFKAFLQAQNANGTPVTVYYVLEQLAEIDLTNSISGFSDFLVTTPKMNLIYEIEAAIPPSSEKITYLKWGGKTE